MIQELLLGSSLFIVGVFCALSIQAMVPEKATKVKQKTNVLFIFADDKRAYGRPL